MLPAQQEIGEDLRQHGEALAPPHCHGRAAHLGQVLAFGPSRARPPGPFSPIRTTLPCSHQRSSSSAASTGAIG